MYRIETLKDTVKLPPKLAGKKLKEALLQSLRETYEGMVDEKTGIIISVLDIVERSEGKIKPMDPNIYYIVKFRALCYKPDLHEVVVGKVIENSKFGSFVRFGPIDGLVHVSQIMDDYVSYDEKNQVFLGKNSKRSLKVGDIVIARIVSVSFDRGTYKVGLTMRQPGLGAITWIEEDKKKQSKKSSKSKSKKK